MKTKKFVCASHIPVLKDRALGSTRVSLGYIPYQNQFVFRSMKLAATLLDTLFYVRELYPDIYYHSQELLFRVRDVYVRGCSIDFEKVAKEFNDLQKDYYPTEVNFIGDALRTCFQQTLGTELNEQVRIEGKLICAAMLAKEFFNTGRLPGIDKRSLHFGVGIRTEDFLVWVKANLETVRTQFQCFRFTNWNEAQTSTVKPVGDMTMPVETKSKYDPEVVRMTVELLNIFAELRLQQFFYRCNQLQLSIRKFYATNRRTPLTVLIKSLDNLTERDYKSIFAKAIGTPQPSSRKISESWRNTYAYIAMREYYPNEPYPTLVRAQGVKERGFQVQDMLESVQGLKTFYPSLASYMDYEKLVSHKEPDELDRSEAIPVNALKLATDILNVFYEVCSTLPVIFYNSNAFKQELWAFYTVGLDVNLTRIANEFGNQFGEKLNYATSHFSGECEMSERMLAWKVAYSFLAYEMAQSFGGWQGFFQYRKESSLKQPTASSQSADDMTRKFAKGLKSLPPMEKWTYKGRTYVLEHLLDPEAYIQE